MGFKNLQSNAVPLQDAVANAFIKDVVGNKTDTVGGDSLVALTKQLIVALGGAAIQMRTVQTESSAVEEDAIMGFGVGIFDVDAGAVVSANIDITGISAVIEKSTGGGAFSAAGLTAITFAKADGLVSSDYRFLASEWEIGDVYKITVGGVTATIDGDTAYVPTMIWSNMIMEQVNVEVKIDGIQTDLSNATDGLGALKALIDANQSTLATIEAEVVEIENHTHSHERWLGKAFEDGGYEIAGTTSPDFDGSYYGYDTVNTKTAYQNKDGSGFLWWDNIDSWIISDVVEVTGTDYFKRTDASAIGAYTNQGSATGTVTGADIADDVHKADDEKMTPFQIDAGNDTFGSWLQVIGTDDTPVMSGKVKIDIHRLVISDVEATADKVVHRLQLAWGASGSAAFTAGDYTCTMFSPEKGGRQDPIDIQVPRIAVGTKVWVRHWANGINTGTLDFYFGIHEYAV